MEGWFPFEHGEQTCLRIAEAAERNTDLDDGLQGGMLGDPAARLLKMERTRNNAAQSNALPNAGVDAGRKTEPVIGEVSLDILLYGKKNKPGFGRKLEYGRGQAWLRQQRCFEERAMP
jgi:hypothetical protein